ncbi:isopentenyl-diphosphate Delta-isomerase [Candidatus Roizmanbacteria bacterium]|nr:isopentenyl-diphosphate Delta-isomerase [Candidatus Roizmanbacteria bacterium]
MKPITLLKLGGSLITDKSTPYTARIAAIAAVAKEISTYKEPLVISHGQGSFAHTSAKKYGGKKGYESTWGIAKVCQDVTELNAMVMKELVEAGVPAVSLRPLSTISSSEGELSSHSFQTVETALLQHLIPVVCGDVIFDSAWKTTIFSGEKVISLLTDYLIKKGYSIKKVIQLGTVDGFYDLQKKVIPLITPQSWTSMKANIFDAQQTDVTGGMKHKIEEAISLARMGISTDIINGNHPNLINCSLSNKPCIGTHIAPDIPDYDTITLVNENNEVTGTAPKLASHHSKTALHRGFSLFLFNEKNQLLLQQRSSLKKTWPLVWSNSVCGHPMINEKPEDAAARRLKFELGIEHASILMALPDYRYRAEKNNIVENEFCPIMIGKTTVKTLQVNPSEVEATKWIIWEDWLKEVKTHPGNYSPWCVEETLLLENTSVLKSLLHK